jgi:hypothetical protein
MLEGCQQSEGVYPIFRNVQDAGSQSKGDHSKPRVPNSSTKLRMINAWSFPKLLAKLRLKTARKKRSASVLLTQDFVSSSQRPSVWSC